VAAIASQMNSDTIGPSLLTDHCCGYDAWLWRSSRLTHCRHVIEIYIETSGHGEFAILDCRFSIRFNAWKRTIGS
jgi:hypothetical protein